MTVLPLEKHAALEGEAQRIPRTSFPVRAPHPQVPQPRIPDLRPAARSRRANLSDHLLFYGVVGSPRTRQSVAHLLRYMVGGPDGARSPLGIEAVAHCGTSSCRVGGRIWPTGWAVLRPEDQDRLLKAHWDQGGTAAVVEVESPGGWDELQRRFPGVRKVDADVPGDVPVRARSLHGLGSECMVQLGDRERRVMIPLPGAALLEALSVALTVGLASSVPLPTLWTSLTLVSTPPGLLEPVHAGQPFRIWVDGAFHPVEVSHVLRTLRPLVRGCLRVVIGGRASMSVEERRALGAAVSAHSDGGVITSDNPGRERVEQLTADVLSGMADPHIWESEPDRWRAVDRVVRQSRAGDGILLLGRGEACAHEVQDAVIPMDDRVLARRALAERGHVGEME